MTTLANIVDGRLATAKANANRLASRMADHRDAGGSDQLSLEAALDDIDRYTRVRDTITADRGSASPYHEGRHSFFADLASPFSAEAKVRLNDHRQVTADLESRDVSTSALAGLVPPSYILELLAPFSRSRSPLADCLSRPIPERGTDITVGRVTTAATVTVQSAEHATISETDPAISALTLPVRTFAGQVDVSQHLFNRATVGTDLVIGSELVAAWAAARESGIINGLGTGGTVTGILATGSISAIAYTDATPTLSEMATKIGYAATTAGGNRGIPDLFVVHPRRWLWMASRTEATTPGFITTFAPPGAPAGCVGSVLGIPVMVSGSIPTNLGSGLDEDIGILLFKDDMVFLESPPVVVAEEQPGAGALSVKFVLRSYACFSAARIPVSVGTIGGTGMLAVAA